MEAFMVPMPASGWVASLTAGPLATDNPWKS